ncbi:MAG: acyltransferase family protein [Myxococcales bacterium]|nr:MAG: acyltransferase family protein [Myxococcales bacterium]
MEMSEQLLGEELDAKVSRIQLAHNEVGMDPFGFDPAVARYGLAFAAFLHRLYFRTEVFGVERVPEGRAIVVANHSGQIPLDAVIITAALLLDAEPPRFARSMVEKWTATLPFISYLYPRFGQVVGSQDNARRLLEQDSTLLVFPEGIRGISKPYQERYKMRDFGFGFMRMALETGTPIVPAAIIGGEEQYPSVANLEKIGKVLGLPALPVLPQLFLGFPLPLPTKYRIYFGEAMTFEGHPDDDDVSVSKKVAQVRDAIDGMLGDGLKQRRSVFW